LQSLERIEGPGSQGSPSPEGGLQILWRYCLPPPQAKVHSDQSYKIIHSPSPKIKLMLTALTFFNWLLSFDGKLNVFLK